MRNELVFIGIHERRRPENFLFPVGELIQIPLTEKTTSLQVYDQLEEHVKGDELAEKAVSHYMRIIGSYRPKQSFFEAQFYIPEPGIRLFAVFNLRSLW